MEAGMNRMNGADAKSKASPFTTSKALIPVLHEEGPPGTVTIPVKEPLESTEVVARLPAPRPDKVTV